MSHIRYKIHTISAQALIAYAKGYNAEPDRYHYHLNKRETESTIVRQGETYQEDNAIFYTPYQIWSYTPENLPQFNTKTPYTELDYYGTLFANQEKEEANIRIRTTQNITPELNILLEYHRFGSRGMLRNEDTDNRNVVMAANYTGKKYLMHTGYIYDRIERGENGGVVDLKMIRDTVLDPRELEVYLNNARNSLKRNTLFLDQTYRIPFTFLDKEYREQKKAEKQARAASEEN